MFVAHERLQRESMKHDPIQYGQSEWYSNRDEQVEYIRTCMLAALDELHEALNETSWKSWATHRYVNSDAFFAELVDAWHFMMNMALASGVADSPEKIADEFAAQYFKKRERNAQRQREGYDGVSSKCPRCRRAYDDEHVECRPPVAQDPRLIGEGALADRSYCAQEEVYF
jgi:hypothetical protein